MSTANFIKKIIIPLIWITKKIKQVMNLFFENYNYITLLCLPQFFLIIVGMGVVVHFFQDIKEDTTSLTNYGFAIIGGLSSICFSWARTLDKVSESRMFYKILYTAEISLHTAIIFILASALKFAAIHIDIMFPNTWLYFLTFIKVILSFTYSICFLAAFGKAYVAIFNINQILFERLDKK